jgi:hypothetical protein
MKTRKLVVAVGLLLGSCSLGMAQSSTESTEPANAETKPAYEVKKEIIQNAINTRQSSVQLNAKHNQLLKSKSAITREELKRKKESSTK